MTPPTQPSPAIPPPPPFFFATDLEDGEVDVDIDQADDNHPKVNDDTQVEQIEIVGEGYRSLAHFFTSQLEDFVDPSVEWILCCLDMREVQRRFEGNGLYRYGFENGTIYRASAKANPKPPPDEDPPGPSMLTRGC